MSKPEPPTDFRSLIETLRDRYGSPAVNERDAEPDQHGDAIVDEVVRGMLQWDAPAALAAEAYRSVRQSVAEYNELRVCFTSEIEAMLPRAYPKPSERSARLRSVLSDVFDREHALSLEHLRDLTKREARSYAESLAGITPFAAARVVLLSLGGHALPIDSRLLTLLIEEGVAAEDADPASAAGRLERAIRAGEAREAYELLETWAADGGPALGLGPPRPKARKGSRDAAATSKPKPARRKQRAK